MAICVRCEREAPPRWWERESGWLSILDDEHNASSLVCPDCQTAQEREEFRELVELDRP